MRLYTKRSRASSPSPDSRGRIRRLARIAAVTVLAVLVLSILIVLPWRWIAPPTTAFMVRQSLFGNVPVRYEWTDWDDIAPALPISAVAAEDQKFPTHSGFDWESIGDAMERNESGGRLRGGSTISQQVAKNLYLWPGQSWIRKGIEAYFTFWIELLWPKRRILEVYLNVAEFGPGVFGVGVASREYRVKPPPELTGYDAAVLIAVLPSPGRMSAARPSDYVRRRADEIQAAVRSLGGSGYLRGF